MTPKLPAKRDSFYRIMIRFPVESLQKHQTVATVAATINQFTPAKDIDMATHQAIVAV